MDPPPPPNTSKPFFPLCLKCSILHNVASGLAYLHERTPPIIHRDLSARNVLLTSGMVAKIAEIVCFAQRTSLNCVLRPTRFGQRASLNSSSPNDTLNCVLRPTRFGQRASLNSSSPNDTEIVCFAQRASLNALRPTQTACFAQRASLNVQSKLQIPIRHFHCYLYVCAENDYAQQWGIVVT